MDPVSLALAGIGMATSIFGGMESSRHAKQAAEISSKIAGVQQQQNAQRQQQMELQAGRAQLQNIRNTQRARSMGLTTAVNQGANFGSGLAGGQAQATSQGNYNALGISQNLEIGRNLFGLDNQISGYRQQLSDIQGAQATDQGIMSIGSAISGSAKMAGQLSQGIGTASSPSSGGNYQGMPWSLNTGNLY